VPVVTAGVSWSQEGCIALLQAEHCAPLKLMGLAPTLEVVVVVEELYMAGGSANTDSFSVVANNFVEFNFKVENFQNVWEAAAILYEGAPPVNSETPIQVKVYRGSSLEQIISDTFTIPASQAGSAHFKFAITRYFEAGSSTQIDSRLTIGPENLGVQGVCTIEAAAY
jgi:hypothetical protein